MSGYIGNSPFTKASYNSIPVIATEGQTTFNVNYSPNFIDVLLNGVELDKTDYVATNGTSVVLNTPTTGTVSNPDTVTFKVWGTFEVADVHTSSLIDTRYGTEGRVQSVDDVTPGALATTEYVAGNTRGMKNYIINGGFDIWQRGDSFSISGSYTADRYRIDNSIDSHTLSKLILLPGELSSSTHAMRNVTNGAVGVSSYASVAQRIEYVRTLAGKEVTISFMAKADTVKDIAFEIQQNFGVGGSPNVTTKPTTNITLSTSWELYSFTVTLPSILGKTIGSSSYLNLVTWFSAGGSFDLRTNSLGLQSGTFDIAQVQLEEGAIATPFEVRPIGLELSLCQRYYEKHSYYTNRRVTQGAGYIHQDGKMRSSYTFMQIKRSVPTFLRSSAGMTYEANGTSGLITGLSTAELATGGALLLIGSSATFPVSQAGSVFMSSNADYLAFDAEL